MEIIRQLTITEARRETAEREAAVNVQMEEIRRDKLRWRK